MSKCRVKDSFVRSNIYLVSFSRFGFFPHWMCAVWMHNFCVWEIFVVLCCNRDAEHSRVASFCLDAIRIHLLLPPLNFLINLFRLVFIYFVAFLSLWFFFWFEILVYRFVHSTTVHLVRVCACAVCINVAICVHTPIKSKWEEKKQFCCLFPKRRMRKLSALQTKLFRSLFVFLYQFFSLFEFKKRPFDVY